MPSRRLHGRCCSLLGEAGQTGRGGRATRANGRLGAVRWTDRRSKSGDKALQIAEGDARQHLLVAAVVPQTVLDGDHGASHEQGYRAAVVECDLTSGPVESR
jgi:hypothetical protein